MAVVDLIDLFLTATADQVGRPFAKLLQRIKSRANSQGVGTRTTAHAGSEFSVDDLSDHNSGEKELHFTDLPCVPVKTASNSVLPALSGLRQKSRL